MISASGDSTGAQVFRGLNPVSVNKLPEVPIQLKIMKRSPKDILQNKQNLVSAAKSSAFQKPFDEIHQLPQNSISAPQSTMCKNSSDVNSDFLQKVEEEITLKLAHLEIIDFGNKGFDLTQLHTVKELEALKYLLYVNRSKELMLMENITSCQEKLLNTFNAETTPSRELIDNESFSEAQQKRIDHKATRYNKLKSLNRSKLAKLLRL